MTGTPFPGTGGVYSTANNNAVTITVHNGSGPDVVQKFTLTVNQPPAILGPNSAAFNVNQNTVNIAISGFPIGTVTVTQTGGPPLPAAITVSVNKATGMVTFSGKPTTPTGANPFVFEINASNGIGPDALEEFTLSVN